MLEQRIGRIYRLGQSSPVDVYNLVCEEGIEARIADVIQQKSAIFSSLFDGTSDAVRFDGQSSFLKTLEKLVDPVAVPVLPPAELDEADASLETRLGDDAAPAVASLSADAREETPPPDHTSVLHPSSLAPISPLAGLQVTRLSDGGLRIDAPPAVAAQLAALLESVTPGAARQSGRGRCSWLTRSSAVAAISAGAASVAGRTKLSRAVGTSGACVAPARDLARASSSIARRSATSTSC